MKKVLLVIIDALSSRHVNVALDDGRLPNMQALVERGEKHDECISIFPSITPAATASIITGCYPAEHGIPGAFFYDTGGDHVFYFGDDIWAILREGVGDFINDFLVRLNLELLSAPTLFQRVEQAGKRAACLNYIIMRGEQKHPVDIPWLLRLFPGVPWKEEITGPDLLCLGDLVAGRPRREEDELSAAGGPFRRYGFQDDSTAQFLLELAKQNALRDLTVAYFPDNDYDSHAKGPTSAIDTLENVDRHLGELFDVCGGVDSFLKDTAILITGDHSQSDLTADEEARGVDVDELLTEFSIVNAGDDWTSDDQIMACPNMRACQIYLRRGRWDDLPRIVERLLSEQRVDQVIWRTELEDSFQFHVRKREFDELTFRKTDGGAGRDAFGTVWDWEGDLEVVDARVTADGRLEYGDYPNAFERIATSFIKPAGGDIWVTARLGHEFVMCNTKLHPAGSHGSLHVWDSTSPMILAGAPEGIALPEHVRTIDAASLCMQILGLEA